MGCAMQKFVITKQEAGWRFDKYLRKLLPQVSSGFLYKMLRKKNITLNERKAAGGEVVVAGDTVELFFSEETFLKFSGKLSGQTGVGRTDGKGWPGKSGSGARSADQPYREAFRKLKNISVVYEDDNILVLNKPAGILSQKAKKGDVSLNEWMIGYLLEKGKVDGEGLSRFRPSVCNRLDRNTSGLVLCGKSVRGSQFLSDILRDRSLHKYYLAYAQGKIEDSITLNGYLKKEAERNRAKVISEEMYRKKVLTKGPERYQEKALAADLERYQKKAFEPAGGEKEYLEEYHRIETVINPISYSKEMDCTKLEILLVTGKSHQIRAHLSEIGHPVLGDVKYGWKPKRKEEMGLKHQLLHAHRVEFPKREGEFDYLSGKVVTAPEPEWWDS